MLSDVTENKSMEVPNKRVSHDSTSNLILKSFVNNYMFHKNRTAKCNCSVRSQIEIASLLTFFVCLCRDENRSMSMG